MFVRARLRTFECVCVRVRAYLAECVRVSSALVHLRPRAREREWELRLHQQQQQRGYFCAGVDSLSSPCFVFYPNPSLHYLGVHLIGTFLQHNAFANNVFANTLFYWLLEGKRYRACNFIKSFLEGKVFELGKVFREAIGNICDAEIKHLFCSDLLFHILNIIS